jgi:hypothetical protein
MSLMFKSNRLLLSHTSQSLRTLLQIIKDKANLYRHYHSEAVNTASLDNAYLYFPILSGLAHEPLDSQDFLADVKHHPSFLPPQRKRLQFKIAKFETISLDISPFPPDHPDALNVQSKCMSILFNFDDQNARDNNSISVFDN